MILSTVVKCMVVEVMCDVMPSTVVEGRCDMCVCACVCACACVCVCVM